MNEQGWTTLRANGRVLVIQSRALEKLEGQHLNPWHMLDHHVAHLADGCHCPHAAARQSVWAGDDDALFLVIREVQPDVFGVALQTAMDHEAIPLLELPS